MANKFCWNHPNMTTLHSAAWRLHAEKLGLLTGSEHHSGHCQKPGPPLIGFASVAVGGGFINQLLPDEARL